MSSQSAFPLLFTLSCRGCSQSLIITILSSAPQLSNAFQWLIDHRLPFWLLFAQAAYYSPTRLGIVCCWSTNLPMHREQQHKLIWCEHGLPLAHCDNGHNDNDDIVGKHTHTHLCGSCVWLAECRSTARLLRSLLFLHCLCLCVPVCPHTFTECSLQQSPIWYLFFSPSSP